MPDSRVGSELAGYRIDSVVGVGGMAVVYLAEHLRLGRRVALKILGPDQSQDEVFRERFIRESRIAARLDHPNVVTVYDAGEAEGVLYISMRFVEGTDLEHLIVTESKLEPSRAISIVEQCAGALDAAHAQGLVHRDVKPANILLERDSRTGDDRAFLSDFGITKRRTEAGLTRTGVFVGTVDYVAPEQIRDWEVDGRADVYSLGCVMYRCLTGEVPFPRTTDVATIYAHLAQPPPRMGDQPGVSGEFDGVIARALAKSPDERFGTCRELAEAAAAAGADLHRDATIPRQQPHRRALRATALSVGLVAVILAGGAAWILATRSRSPGGLPQAGPTTTQRLTWNQASRSDLGGERRQDIVKAVATSSSVIAVGHDASGPNGDAAAWTSTDGTSWTRVPPSELAAPGNQELSGVAVLGTDVVAVGSDTSSGTMDAAVWISHDDGTSWSRAADPGLVATGDQVMRRVIAAPPGLVALGYTAVGNGRDAAVWTSTDGESWTPVPSSDFAGAGDQEIFSVATFEGQIIAVGSSATASGDLDAAVWIESEGVWSRVASDPLEGPRDQQMTSVIATGSGLVAVGYNTAGGDHDAAVWTSSDGRIWRRARSEGFRRGGDQQMYAVTEVGTTLVAAGTSETSSGDTNAAIWLSTGISWTQVPGNDLSMAALVGPAKQRVKSLVVFDGLLVALGSEAQGGRDDAAVWFARLTQADVSPPSGSPTSASP
jgi:serine/threonine-protein kinase